ncbi:uncharacterized protein LOC105389751 isoform X1 [Plutella xylostella]|uniref:uncharacterized protein LOC105389751 isoform X1 n=2 Tax=Plutella xylostella TaxID=51655 RepID=UPI002032D3E0|nr:uncharacterized protein LOC105389751 isoform X1 [Plutella xylostella]
MVSNIVIVLFSCSVIAVSGTLFSRHDYSNDNSMDVTDFSVYYDMKTNDTIRKMMPRPWYKPGWLLRLPFTGGPCQCEGLHCSCCTGIRIQTFNFDRKACTKLTYEPNESLVAMEVTLNDESVYRSSFSARNPPPFCIPVPVPYLPPGLVDMCIRFFDVSVVEQRLHVCMDWDTRIDKAPVLVLHFDCMDMGLSGVSLSKPGGSGGTNPGTASEPGEPTQVNADVYDPVTETIKATKSPFLNAIKYI